MPSRTIPLFPLHVVVFPGMPLPLHISKNGTRK
jgi:Lon protease-like protein